MEHYINLAKQAQSRDKLSIRVTLFTILYNVAAILVVFTLNRFSTDPEIISTALTFGASTVALTWLYTYILYRRTKSPIYGLGTLSNGESPRIFLGIKPSRKNENVYYGFMKNKFLHKLSVETEQDLNLYLQAQRNYEEALKSIQ